MAMLWSPALKIKVRYLKISVKSLPDAGCSGWYFRDVRFSDDSAKINVEEIFKLMSPHTEVKVI